MLDPSINRSPWSSEEDKILLEAHKELGSKWVELAKLLPGRKGDAIKKRWRTKAFQSTYFKT